MYSTRKFWRLLLIIVLMALLAGTVPWGAVTVKLESWRMELQTGRLERRIVDMLQRALAQAERGIRTWGK